MASNRLNLRDATLSIPWGLVEANESTSHLHGSILLAPPLRWETWYNFTKGEI